MSYIEHASQWAEIDPDLERLFYPASAFDHPQDVVKDPDLTTEEKRGDPGVLASDACAVESQPAMRLPLGATQPVGFDDIVEALAKPRWSATPKMEACAATATIREYGKPKWRLPEGLKESTVC